MIFVLINDVLLKRLLIDKLRCVKLPNGIKRPMLYCAIRYLPPIHRYIKTNTNLHFLKASETSVELSSVCTPKSASDDMGIKTLDERILTASSKYPNLSLISVDRLKSILPSFCELGFSYDDGLIMVGKCSEILGRTRSQLLQTISAIRKCNFTDEDIISILYSSPELFVVNSAHFVPRYKSLRKHFSHNSVKLIYHNCPGIIKMSWKVVQDKVEYLHNVMNIPSHEIAQSKALNLSLDELKARHLFLERAGLFKIPDPKSKVPSKNHKLYKITDTEEEHFAVKIAGLTHEEFYVFKDLLPLEVDDISDGDVEEDE